MAMMMPLSQRNAGRGSSGVWLAAFFPPHLFLFSPFLFPFVAQVCKRKNKMKERKKET
jgi:hypothetical protein